MPTSIPTRSLSPIWLISLVAFCSMLAPFSIDTYLPSFPAIEVELAIDRALLTQSLALYLAGFALATLVWGPLADRFGRRKMVLLSLSGYVLASLVCAWAQNLEQLLFGRVLQGVMAAGSVVASRAMIRDYFSGRSAQSAMAMVMMLFTLGPAVAPIVGGWLEVQFGWRSVFWFLTSYALFVALLFAWRIPETQDPANVQSIHPRQLGRSYWHSVRHPLFLRLALLQGLLIGGFFIYVAASASLIYQHLGWQEQDFWRLFLPMVGGILFGSWLAHFLSERLRPTQMIVLALIVASVAVTVNLGWQTLGWQEGFWVIAPLSLYAIGFALANPALSILGLDCLPQKRGMAASLQSFMQMGTAALVAALLVPLVDQSLWAMAMAQALLLLSALLLWWRVARGAQHLESAA